MESVFTKDEIARYQYDQAEKARRDYIAAINHATTTGKAEGEARMARVIAKNLLAAGVPKEVVQKATNLSLEEIEQIKDRKLN